MLDTLVLPFGASAINVISLSSFFRILLILFLSRATVDFIRSWILLHIGTRINIAHQDPNLPVELEIRRTVVKRIARLLEEKWLKTISFEYI